MCCVLVVAKAQLLIGRCAACDMAPASGLTMCPCDNGWFGRDGVCVHCPDTCDCNATTIGGCYPVMSLGSVIPVGGISPGARLDRPFQVDTLLSCPSTVSGLPLCNPSGIPWPQ